MATFTATKVSGVNKGGGVWMSSFTVAGTGTYTSGGDTLDLSGVAPGSDHRVPLDVSIKGIGGFDYRYVKSTLDSNGKIMVFVNTAGGANSPLGEHSAAALATGVTADTISGVAVWDGRGLSVSS